MRGPRVVRRVCRQSGRRRIDFVLDVNDTALDADGDRRCSLDDGRFDLGHASVAAAAQHARLEHVVPVGVREVAEQLLRHDGLDRLVVDLGRHRDRTLRVLGDHDGVTVELHARFGVRQGTQARVDEERVVEEVTISVDVLELRERGRILTTNPESLFVARNAVLADDQI